MRSSKKRRLDKKTLINLWYLKEERKIEVVDGLLKDNYAITNLKEYQEFICYLVQHDEVKNYQELLKTIKLQLKLIMDMLDNKFIGQNYLCFSLYFLIFLVDEFEYEILKERLDHFNEILNQLKGYFYFENNFDFIKKVQQVQDDINQKEMNDFEFKVKEIEKCFQKENNITLIEKLENFAKNISNEKNSLKIINQVFQLESEKKILGKLKKNKTIIEKAIKKFFSRDNHQFIKNQASKPFDNKSRMSDLSDFVENWEQIPFEDKLSYANEIYGSLWRSKFVQIFRFNELKNYECFITSDLSKLTLDSYAILFSLLISIPLDVNALTFSPLRKQFTDNAKNAANQSSEASQTQKINLFCFKLKNDFQKFLDDNFKLILFCFNQQINIAEKSTIDEQTIRLFQDEVDNYKKSIDSFFEYHSKSEEIEALSLQCWNDLNNSLTNFKTSKMSDFFSQKNRDPMGVCLGKRKTYDSASPEFSG